MFGNLGRAKEMMRCHGLDALIAASPVNVHYLTGFRHWLVGVLNQHMVQPGESAEPVPSFGIITAEGRVVLVADVMFSPNMTDDVDDAYFFGLEFANSELVGSELPSDQSRLWEIRRKRPIRETAFEALGEALRKENLIAGRIGMDIDTQFPKTVAAVQQAAETTILDASNLFRLIRMVKSDRELACMVRAAEIAERALGESLSQARVGMPWSEIVNVYRRAVGAAGADFDHLVCSPHGLGIDGTGRGILRAGEMLYVDFGCSHEGYYSDAGITLVTHTMSDETFQHYETLREAVEKTGHQIRPGMKSSEAETILADALREHNVNHHNAHGHGLGLEPCEYPVLVPDNGLRIRDNVVNVPSDLTLEAGMVLNLETPVFQPPVYSMHLEKTFLLTAHSCDGLVSQDRSRPITCG